MEPSTPPEQASPISPEPITNPTPPQVEPPAATNAGDTNKLPSAFALFKPSWEAVKLNLVTFIALSVLSAALYFIIVAMLFGTGALSRNPTGSLGAGAATAFAVGGVVGLVWMALIGPALVYLQVKSANGVKVGVSDALKNGLNFAIRFLGLSIVMGLIIFVGFLLLIVPGFYMLRRYILAPYFLVDKDLGINEAMNQSAEVSKKYSGALWGLIGVTFLIGLPGIIPVLGSIISAILGIAYYCAPAVRYKEVTTGVPSVAVK
ncbi:MAG TPA: YciC family protein [Candidatus Saccharimonadales bacterium]|nr:YciC family protein [Candidatus Saccharimonadales bacterium]